MSQAHPDPAPCQGLHRAGAALLGLLAITCLVHQVVPHKAVQECLHWLVVLGMVLAYVVGWRALEALPQPNQAMPAVAGYAVGFAILSVCIPPFHSIDIYFYINSGWLQAEYGQNPYFRVPAEIRHWRQDPMFCTDWSRTATAYGFLHSGMAWLVCRLGQGNLPLTVLLFQSMNVAALGLTGWLVARGCRRLGLPGPARPLYLLWWNPLLLIHGIANGHNDVWMALFMVLALYLAIRGSWAWVLPALVASTLIKYGAAVLLPFAFLYLVKAHGWRRAALSAALAIVVAALCAAPYLAGSWRVSYLVRMLTDATGMHNSLPALVYFPIEVWSLAAPSLQAHQELARSAIKLLFWTAFLGFVARLALSRCRGRYEPACFVRDALLLQFVLICLVSSKFHAWYLGMFFPLALWAAPGDWLQRGVLALSCGQMLSLTFVNQTHGLNVLVMLVVPLVWALQRVDAIGRPVRGSEREAASGNQTDWRRRSLTRMWAWRVGSGMR